MLYFKRLLEVEDLFVNKTNSIGLSDSEISVLERQKEIIAEINKYIFSFEWLSYRKAKDFMKEVVNYNFDYLKICEVTGRPYQSVRATVSMRASEAEEKVGYNTLNLLTQGKCTEAYFEFLIASGQFSMRNYAIGGIMDMLPEPNIDASVKFSDCEQELKFLKAVSKLNFADKISSLNKDNLSFLLAVLEGKGSYLSIPRSAILRYLLGDISYQDLLIKLRE